MKLCLPCSRFEARFAMKLCLRFSWCEAGFHLKPVPSSQLSGIRIEAVFSSIAGSTKAELLCSWL